MKNTIKLFGIIALVAIIGFSLSSCGDDDENGNGGGILTINNLPTATEDYRVNVHNSTFENSDDVNIVAKGRGKGSPISLFGSPNFATSVYKESGSRLVVIMPLEAGLNSKYTTITFSNGSATIDWNTMTNVPE